MPTLCIQLNKLLKGGEVSLPPHMRSINKFKMFFFEPTHFIKQAGESDNGMPEELFKALLGVLQSKNVDPATMRKLLSYWWQIAMSRPIYQGPYPERVAVLRQ
jgi:hypothetical protein